MDQIILAELRKFFQRIEARGVQVDLDAALTEASELLAHGAAIATTARVDFNDRQAAFFLAKQVYRAFVACASDDINRIALAHFDRTMQDGAVNGMCPTYKGVAMAQWQFDALMEADGFKPAPKATGA